jgi:predicted TIM-barrel fold metal-dependent hydrolase
MKPLSGIRSICIGVLCIFLQNCTQSKPGSSTEEAVKAEFYTMQDFSTVKKYDAHVHLNIYDTTFIKQAKDDGFQLITVNVNTAYYPSVEAQRKVALELVKDFPDRLHYSTAFDLDDWGTAKWQPQTLAYLDDSFKKGAVAVKIWKNIGMALKDKSGKFVMIDDARFDPVLDFIEKNNITLIAHLGEPRNAWLPVEQMTVSNDKRYFTEHPEYHMYKHPENPSYEDEINARDKMLKKHPKLRVVGAHMGSLEWDVDELAKRLDQYPNLAVDLAARIVHLQVQSVKNWQKVHDFMVKYQDRLIYATDHGVDAKSNVAELNKSLHTDRLEDWEYLATGNEMKGPSFEGAFKGLKLPKDVIDKIYYTNAKKWFPGI